VQASTSQAKNIRHGIPETPAAIGVSDRSNGTSLPTHIAMGDDFSR